MIPGPVKRIGCPVLAVIATGCLAAAILSNSYYTYVANISLINAIAAIGLVVLTGIAGQLSLATAGMMAVGAYACAIMTGRYGIPFVVALPASAIVTMVVGSLLTLPALRLGGLHLAIVTLASGVIIVQVIGKGGSFTGGMTGLTVDTPSILGWAFDTERRRFVGLSVIFLVVAGATQNLRRLKPGRALLALRQREKMAQMLGVDTRAYKALAFAYSSFLAGLAGALYAGAKGYVSVDDFTLWHSIYFYIMISIGGATSVLGGVLGAVFVTALPESLRGLDDAAQAVFGVILVLVIVFLPNGVVPFVRDRWRARIASTTEAQP